MIRLLFKILLFMTFAAALALAVCSILGFFGQGIVGKFEWELSFFSHFRFQYCVLLSLLSFLMIILITVCKQWKSWWPLGLLLSLIALFINCNEVLPYYVPYTEPSYDAKIKILHVNVFGKNHNTKAVTQLIEQSQADIISLQEYNNWWRDQLDSSEALKKYPYRYSSRGMDDGLYSKIPFTKIKIDFIPETGHKDQTIIADFELKGQPITLLMAHPPTPIKPDLYKRLKMHFDRWLQLSPTFNHNLIVVGDLNSTPWFFPFQRFQKTLHLHDTQMGFGLQRSFPTHSRFKAISIDHCLIRGNLMTLHRYLGPHVGSDHFPVIIELGLTNPSRTHTGINIR